MGMSLASIGGFCAGKTFVIDHQRLCGLGYCFSASTPPYLATAAIKALKVIDESPELLTKLRENTEFFRKLLQRLVLHNKVNVFQY
jgi:serine palmitoyltransferase